jgi:hypothetical protein
MAQRRAIWAFLLISTTLLVSTILADWLPHLRGPAPETSEWYWPYLLRPASRWWAPLLAAAILLAVAAWWFSQSTTSRRLTVVGIMGLILGNLLLQIALIYADRPAVAAELIDRTLSNLASGFFEPAAEIDDLNLALQAYPELMPTFVSEHARTHPPGLLVANRLTIEAFATLPGLSERIARYVWPLRCTDLWLLNQPGFVAAALLAWALIPLLAGAFTLLPAYALARRLLQPRPARLATAMVATMPALLLFAPKSVQLYPPLTFGALLALQLGLERHRAYWFFLSGAIISLSTFLSLGNASILALCAFYTWLHRRLESTGHLKENDAGSAPLPAWRPVSLLARVGAFGLGAASIWLMYWLVWAVPAWDIARTGLQQHYHLVTSFRRYGWWVIFNLVDLFMYAGLPLAIGFIAAALVAFRETVRRRSVRPKLLAVALAMFIVLLDISGTARGEVGRVWLFFIPLLALVSGDYWARLLPGRSAATGIIGLQLAVTVSLGLAWRPVRAVIVVAERPSMPVDDSPQYPLAIGFSGTGADPGIIELAGYDLGAVRASPGESLHLTLHWNAAGSVARPYTVFTHLIDGNGEIAAQKDNWSINGQWPPTCWRRGDVIIDPFVIELPDRLPEGNYRLLVGMYDARDETRLKTNDGRDAVLLTEITVAAAGRP